MADLELRQEGEVVWATMNRPDRLNALSRNLVTELREFPDRGHSLALDHGWREVAEAAVTWLDKHALA